MNNQQFRRLVLDTPRQQDGGASKSPPARPPGTVLGARQHPSIPMTPRQVGRSSVRADFARQLAERNAKAKPTKKFKSSAPKGTKLAAGYVDRTKMRADDDGNEMAQRIKNLEDSMKLGQMDRGAFEKLVQEITGGDIKSTHLVKGLDRKLLERVRKGEDVYAASPQARERELEPEPDVEDEFDLLAEQEVGQVVREKAEKKGEMAPPRPVAGVKRSRNDILAELKAQRQAAAEAAAAEHEKKYPSLGLGFRKVSARGETSRIEIDANGREVLIITDADGKEKRKIRKQKVEEPPPEVHHRPHDERQPTSMHSLSPPKADESEDEDIFEGVGSNYNPLANFADDDDSSSGEDGGAKPPKQARLEPGNKGETSKSVSDQLPGPEEADGQQAQTNRASLLTATSKPPVKRNYFKDTASTSAPSSTSTGDATVFAALKKVRTLDPNSALLQPSDSDEARLKKRAADLTARDRDLDDIDMGFGGSRFDDAEDMERDGEKVKFSEWKGLGAEDDDEGGGQERGGKKRKRGPKKKKGDKDSAADVLKAMERQREKKALG